MAGLVARALAVRPTAWDAWSVDGWHDPLVNTAAALALIDPATARWVLAGVAPPAEYADKALTQNRGWPLAPALADPARAVPLVDKLLAKANARPAGGGNSPSGTELVELGSVLTAADRPKELESYGNLLCEPSDDEE